MAENTDSSSSLYKLSMNTGASPSRIGFLKNVVPTETDHLLNYLAAHDSINSPVSDNTLQENVNRFKLANDLATATGEDAGLTKSLLADTEVQSLRDVTLKYSDDKLEQLFPPDKGTKPLTLSSAKLVSATPSRKVNALSKFQNAMFNAETSAFIQRMLQNGELSPNKKSSGNPTKAALLRSTGTVKSSTPDPAQSGMAQVLKNKPDFHFRKHAISTLLGDPASFTNVPEEDRPAVINGLKTISLAQSLTSTPKALPTLVNSKLSAFRVAQLPEDQFVERFGDEVGGPDIAKNIHTHAVQVSTRNDHALTSILQTVRGTGIAAIDGREPLNERFNRLIEESSDLPEQIDLERLFGSLDYCECSDCTSVTSPAAYFVELLQFLRNNNLNPNTPWSQWSDVEDFRDSPLDYLFRRRPDLACLELTCANTDTVLPYIDLANEVMESFIYHQKKYVDSNSSPKQAWIDIFNASDNADGLGGSSEELLAVPQNVNMQAYLALQQSVYPAAKLPYHQPIDAIRQFLTFLGTSRAEVFRLFQAKYNPPTTTTPDTWTDVSCPPAKIKDPPPCPLYKISEDCSDSSDDDDDCCDDSDDDKTKDDEDPDGFDDSDEYDDMADVTVSGSITSEDQVRLIQIHQEALSRAIAAEELGITQEEYVILTKQAFWRKAHFDIRHGEDVSVATYRKNIGVKKDWEYWGLDYMSPADMLDATKGEGLTFVKDQFLPRTGVLYADLVDMLRTNYINSNMPKGRAKVILESFHFSYQFLASKINTQEKHRMARLHPLLQFLEHPVDKDSGFQKVLLHSLKNQTCCQLLFKNRQEPARRLAATNTSSQPNGDQMSHKSAKCECGCDAELKDWICKYFESVGKIIVLDSGEGQKLPWEGDIIASDPPVTNPSLTLAVTAPAPAPPAPAPAPANATITPSTSPSLADGETLVGHIHNDGSVTQSATSSILVGYVALSGVVYDTTSQPLANSWPGKDLTVVRTDKPTGDDSDGFISSTDSMLHLNGIDTPTPWTVTYDDCDLTKVRLQHLDGKSVTRQEYDRMHRFLRLWRKLGWTIAEVDAAISAFGLGPQLPSTPGTTTTTAEDDDVDYDDFQQQCDCGLPTCAACNSSQTELPKIGNKDQGKYCSHCGKLRPVKGKKPTNKHCGCKHGKPSNGRPKPSVQSTLDISPYLINQTAAVKKIIDLVGLSILQVLALWTTIDTHGDSSLYAQLFLTHNMLGVDRIFVPDADGNYLVQSPPAKISEHRPILLAAFNLKPDDLDNIIHVASITNDQLTLENVSAIYRHSTLAKILGVKPKDLGLVFQIFSTPWESAEKVLDLLKLWSKVTDAGFDIKQFAFIFNDIDDPLQPIGPTEIAIAQLAATIYSSLKDIEVQQPMITTLDDATSATVTAKAQLIFSQATVTDILGFLEGTRVYSTNAPKIDNVTIPQNLSTKLKYVTGDSPTVQSVGQLTTTEIGQAKAVAPANSKWLAAIDRLSKQALTFFNTVLGPIFRNKEDAKTALVSGDITTSDVPDTLPTPPAKRLFFLQSFIPFLQSQLSTQSIVATMSSASSIESSITAILLQDILRIDQNASTGDAGTSALNTIEAIKNDPTSQTSWSGYLVINTTDKYTLYAKSTVDDNKPAAISINGIEYDFSNQQEDPTNVWYGQPIQLTGGKLYSLSVRDQVATKLMWKTDLTVPATIPSSFLIPAHATSGVSKVLTLLIKSAFFVNGFNLSLDEVVYFQMNGADFDGFDWNSLKLAHWKRLNAYVLLKKSLPTSFNTLLRLFTWAKNPGSKAKDTAIELNKATQWAIDDITKLIASKHFNLQAPTNFKNEISLVKLQEALTTAKKISVDIDKLFDWAKPAVSFTSLATIANDIKTAIRTKYSLSDWDKAIKPTYDILRQNQSNALVAYLVVQPTLVKQGVIDSDSLFEFFLIDPSMCPCMETSRLKQATSSIQLFIQRCLLGLEDQQSGFGQGVSLDLIDRTRWLWMQRYRLWEANRKVYLFPENWIQASLRDDKSPQFKALESELLQKDISESSVLNAMKNYLFAIDEVANLRTVALFVEDMPNDTAKNNFLGTIQTVHFFGRSASSPYKYYHRTFDAIYATWTPWTLMQIDVPNYEIERKGSGNQNLNGCYVVPFTYNGRLIVGLPQFMKKQVPQKVPDQSFSDIAQGQHPVQASSLAPLEYWEIKFGYTELLNGTWKQKVISSDAVWEAPVTQIPEASEYQFAPEIQVPSADLSTVVHIDVLRNGSKVGRFAFNGSRVVRDDTEPAVVGSLTRVFQYTDGTTTHTVTSLQSLSTNNTSLEYSGAPTVTYPVDSALDSKVSFPQSVDEPFNHQFLHALISRASSASNLDQFFGYFQNDSFKKDEAWGTHLWDSASKTSYNELYRTYSLYNWEMAFHAPMLLVDKLLETQQFDLALKMCQYVFDPFAKGSGVKRYWKMPPFQDIDSMNSLEKLFSDLKPNASVPKDDPINQWRDNPFQPHVLARLRPVSYMKWTVMKYIEVLIAYGDWYFQQNTLEMIPMAIQMYVLASHIYGPRSQKIPRRGKKRPQTYFTLLNKWDAFGNAMVQLELDFPFSNQIQTSFGQSNGVEGLANIFGFATNRYFCIPNNDQLSALRDKIDDRLFKIRHCQDINGVFRILPLYEPPLDVGQLVAATAAGLSLRSILNDLNAPMPNYKFPILLAKALELCGELKALGSAFLSAKEKGDSEALSVLRQRQDLGIQGLLMDQKKLALQEAQANLDALVSSRTKPEYQLRHTLKLLGQDVGLVPTSDGDWQELKDDIAAPVQDSGLTLSAEEKEEMDKSSEAKDVNSATSVIQAIASDLKAFPTINGHASPFGVGVAACWGPGFIGDVMNGVAQVIKIEADTLTYESTNASRKNGHMRTNQDRTQTANSTGYELKNIDKQITASKARIDIANQEITNQQKQIDNSQEVLDFLTSKYTNQDLYSFMEGRVRTLYYQTYQMAYSWARKAEACFRFDRGIKDTNFIQPGYWEPGHDGLLSGEALFMSLKNLEAAYHEDRGHDFEVSKFFSLRQNNPLALLQLRENAACEFAVPEILYDMDFPGHYLRKIKAVTLTIPCIIGPYTTVNCTVRLTSHKYRFDSTARDKKDYVEKTPDQGGSAINGDPRFDTVLVPITAAAVSTANNDGGVFDLSFSNAERFMPFEGAGAISQWSLSLPSGFRQFDYSTIQNVVMHIRYTSRDGGDKLAGAASGAVTDYIKAVTGVTDGLFSIVDARTEYATQWAAFIRTPAPPPAPQQRVLLLNKLNERLPIYTKGHPVNGLVAQDVWVITDAQVASGALTITQGNNTLSFTDGPAGKGLKTFVAPGPVVISDWTLTLADVGTPVNRLWVVMRYLMK